MNTPTPLFASSVSLIMLTLLFAGCAAQYTEPNLPDTHPASAKATASPMPERWGTLDLTKADPLAAMPAQIPMPTPMSLPMRDMAAPSGHEGHVHPAPEGNIPDTALYTCPMHPEVVSKEPGRCPKCNMKLVPKQNEGGHE